MRVSALSWSLRVGVVLPTIWALLILQFLVMPPESWVKDEVCKMACGKDERTCCCRLMAKATGQAPRHQHGSGPAFEELWRVCPIPEMALSGSSAPSTGLRPKGAAPRFLTSHDPAKRRSDLVVIAERPDLGLLPRPPPAFLSSC